MQLEWSEPPPPGLGILGDWGTGGDNDLETRWAEVWATSGLDWAACGFHWNAGELQEAALIAHASRASGLEINSSNMALLEEIAGVDTTNTK